MEPAERSRGDDSVALAINVRQADAEYKSFPPFGEWSKASVDTERWDHYASRLPEHGRLTSEQLVRAQEVAKRAAAVDTGAIEGLYEVDRGLPSRSRRRRPCGRQRSTRGGQRYELSLSHSWTPTTTYWT